jgi:hypothetical protein
MQPDVTLSPPERNRYFYGLMMDAERFEKDQRYFNRKRHLLNRLALGSGVLCGLNLTFDGSTGALTLDPGVAIDGEGREIVVPAATVIDTAYLTDSRGKATGPTPAGATILISLGYAEQKIDPVPVLVADCDHPNGCAPSAVEEGFVVIVTKASAVPSLPGCVLTGGFPLPPGAQLHAAVAAEVSAACTAIPADVSVALGRFTLAGGPLDTTSDRTPVFNNVLLYQLIVCLADRVAQISGDMLMYVSGDNQSGPSGTALPQPLVVKLVDAAGNPVTGGSAPVFTVAAAGGSVSAVQANPGSEYQVSWTLGSSGAQTVIAKSADSKFTVTFHATIAP